MSNRVSVDVTDLGDRLVVTLDRPETRNAIDLRMVGELHAVCEQLERTPRVLVIQGSSHETGGQFASGADIGELVLRRRDDALRGYNSGLFDRIAALPMPVIAALDGSVLGGGVELALAADLRIGTARMSVGNPEVGLGIIAGAGATWRLRDIVGEAVARDLLLTGRRLDGVEALAVQFITELWPADELRAAAQRLADRICGQDPLAVRLTKTVMRMPRSAHPDVDNLAQAILFESDGKQERMSAFLARRKTKP